MRETQARPWNTVQSEGRTQGLTAEKRLWTNMGQNNNKPALKEPNLMEKAWLLPSDESPDRP